MIQIYIIISLLYDYSNPVNRWIGHALLHEEVPKAVGSASHYIGIGDSVEERHFQLIGDNNHFLRVILQELRFMSLVVIVLLF